MADATAPSLGRVFISYRREDTAYAAGWLYDRLVDRLGRDQIFKDIDSIELGDDWVEVIGAAVGSCDVLLALIGDQWLTIDDAQGRNRLDNPEDFVRLEIEAALARHIRVIPVLVEGATMPGVDELPASLSKLTRRQALELSPNSFDFDTTRLLEQLDRNLAEVHAQPTEAVTSTVTTTGTGTGTGTANSTATGTPTGTEPDPAPRVVEHSVDATATPDRDRAAEERDRRARKRRRALTAAAIGAAVIGIAIAALLVLLPSDGSRDADHEPRTVDVAGDKKWTDTHVECKVGDVLDISATGTILHEQSATGVVGPDGLTDPIYHKFNVAGLPNANTAGLIGSIDGQQPFFFVGSETSHECRRAGTLLLGINDIGLFNNSGAFTATIKFGTP